MAALNNFASKLVNSGHTLKSIRSILINGIRGHLRKVERCRKSGSPFHRSAAQSAPLRRTKKLLAKTKWFRDQPKSGGEKREGGCTTPLQRPTPRSRGEKYEGGGLGSLAEVNP